jgi:arabinose-5-phosphate isomerase
MGLLERFETETVEKLNIRNPITIDASASVRRAIEKMRAGRLGCAIVVDSDHKPIGVFTEAILRHLLANSPPSIEGQVDSAMARNFPCVQATDKIEFVLQAMELKNTRFVVVVDRDGRVCGLTGQKGLMEYIAEYFPHQVMVQRIGTRPYPSNREGA